MKTTNVEIMGGPSDGTILAVESSIAARGYLLHVIPNPLKITEARPPVGEPAFRTFKLPIRFTKYGFKADWNERIEDAT